MLGHPFKMLNQQQSAGVLTQKKKRMSSTLPQEDKFRRVRRLFLDNDVDNSGELGRQELDVAFIQMAPG